MVSHNKEKHYKSRHRNRVQRSIEAGRQGIHAYNYNDLESRADTALSQGRFDDGIEMLERIRGKRQVKAGLKLACVPFYEIDFAQRNNVAVSDELASEVECVHADIVEVIRSARQEYLQQATARSHPGETDRMQHLRGDISECIVAALFARRFNEDGRVFMLPAPRSNDMSRVLVGGRFFSIDGILVRTDPDETGPRSIQIKTGHYASYKQYSTSILMVAVGKLPGGNRLFTAENHLSQMLIDDIDATISPDALLQVDQADNILADMVHPFSRAAVT